MSQNKGNEKPLVEKTLLRGNFGEKTFQRIGSLCGTYQPEFFSEILLDGKPSRLGLQARKIPIKGKKFVLFYSSIENLNSS